MVSPMLLLLSAAEAQAGTGAGPAQPWWMTPRRMIQTNLREIDAAMDVEAYVAALRDFHANVVLFNVGGIVANYPTDLPFHHRNPHMRGDLTGQVVRRLHAEGIRVIGRFDFSKIHQSIARQHPEWLSRDAEGNAYPPYNGQVPTCLNGGYQQEGMFRILDEALDRYPLDGVFFNMIGFPRSDYSGRNLGLCQCDACRKRFRAASGLELPRRAGPDEAYRRYEAFCREVVSEQFLRVRGLVKGRDPNAAICTYTPAGVDVIRTESNTPFGQWTYEDTDKARRTLLAHPDKMLSNAAVHFIRYPQRHSSVSPHLTRRRLVQHMLNGAWLDFYCIGPLHAQEDRLGLDAVRDVFGFHAANQRWLTGTLPAADVGLAVEGAGSGEYRGLFRILSEAHVSFALTSLDGPDLGRFAALIVPGPAELSPAAAARLDEYVRAGGRLLLTGPPCDGLQCLGIRRRREAIAAAPGTYIRIRPEDKLRLGHPLLDKLDLVFLDGELWPCEADDEVEGLLRFIPPAMFGPPEKCYYTQVSDVPCLLTRRSGRGGVAWFGWQVGQHYDRQGHAGHAALVIGALDGLLRVPRRIRIQAHPTVEVNHRVARGGGFEWLGLVNHSGLLERALHEPVPLRDLAIELQPQAKVKSIRLLRADRAVEFTAGEDGRVRWTVPELRDFEVVLLEQ